MAKDSTVRRVTVSNDDGDVYVETSGASSEIVLKSAKVRVDGDVYCYDGDVGISQRVDGLAVKDTALSGRVDDLNATDAELKTKDAELSVHVASLNATDAALKGVDEGLSSRIDALVDVYIHELNLTDKQLVVTDATLGSRVDTLNATQYELKGADAGLSIRLDSLESSRNESQRVDAHVSALIASLNDTDATMKRVDEGLANRLDVLNATDDGLKSRLDVLNATNTELKTKDTELTGRIDDLNATASALTPPKCMPPGGDKLRFDGTNWLCVCVENWSGTTCETTSPNVRLRSYVTDGRNISDFDTSNVTDMRELFMEQTDFNQDLSRWNTSAVTSMAEMFYNARAFNGAIGSWDVSSVTDMSYMFYDASEFNQDLNDWNVSGVTNFHYMFSSARRFNGDITRWDVRGAERDSSSMNNMFADASAFNRDIRSWEVPSDVNTYGMFRETRFVQSFKCPDDENGPPSACYVTPFSSSVALEQAVDACFEEEFDGSCQCLDKCGEAGLPISSWNTAGLLNMHDLFADREFFNEDLSKWDTSRAIRMDDMFRNAKAFNRDISSWVVDSVRDMSNMFNGATTFSRNLTSWRIASGANFTDMFKGATAHNARFTCDDADDGPPSSCAATAYPSSLAHRFDFSETVQTSGDVVTSFLDATGKATDVQVVGSPTYARHVQAGLNAINFTANGQYLQFTADGGSEPEVFIVYRVLAYAELGVIFTQATGSTGSYGFGTSQMGAANKIGLSASDGSAFASVNASYDAWHVADVYFGSSDGFVDVDNGTSAVDFQTSGKYTANTLTNVMIGGAAFDGHHVPNLIGEVLVFNAKLSDSDRARVRAALMSKWDVPTPDRRWRYVQKAKMTASDPGSSDYCGSSVSVSGDTVVVGAAYDDDNGQSNSGSAYVFTRSGTTWTRTNKLSAASDAGSNDYFGSAVGISDGTIVVGAYAKDRNSTTLAAGAAYAFALSSS